MRSFIKLLFFLILFFNCYFSNASQKESLIHLHSDFSTGSETIEQVAEKAQQRGINVIFMTDHDVIRVEYGIPLFRNLFKKSYELQSVTRRGASEYTEKCRTTGTENNMIVILGVESTAHYYWSGNPLDDTLTANNWQKHILVIGFHNGEEIDNLPVIHNGYSLRYFRSLFAGSLIFGAAFIFSIILYRRGGKVIKIFSICASFISLLFIINYHPFRSSLFTQYQQDAGTRPYQELIDYAVQKNLLTIWAHPESYREKEINGVKMITPKYAEDLINTTGYTAFEGLYRDTSEMINPGKEWDIILQQFLNNERENPVWTVGGIDYHGDEKEEIDEVETIFTVDSLSEENVLEALRKGHCYARRKSASANISISKFILKGNEGKNSAQAGENLFLEGDSELTISLAEKNENPVSCSLTIIKRGDVFVTRNISLPFEESFAFSPKPEERGYFRIIVSSEDGGKVLSNPVFFNVPLNK